MYKKQALGTLENIRKSTETVNLARSFMTPKTPAPQSTTFPYNFLNPTSTTEYLLQAIPYMMDPFHRNTAAAAPRPANAGTIVLIGGDASSDNEPIIVPPVLIVPSPTVFTLVVVTGALVMVAAPPVVALTFSSPAVMIIS